jgi:hypothetical protein
VYCNYYLFDSVVSSRNAWLHGVSSRLVIFRSALTALQFLSLFITLPSNRCFVLPLESGSLSVPARSCSLLHLVTAYSPLLFFLFVFYSTGFAANAQLLEMSATIHRTRHFTLKTLIVTLVHLCESSAALLHWFGKHSRQICSFNSFQALFAGQRIISLLIAGRRSP